MEQPPLSTGKKEQIYIGILAAVVAVIIKLFSM